MKNITLYCNYYSITSTINLIIENLFLQINCDIDTSWDVVELKM